MSTHAYIPKMKINSGHSKKLSSVPSNEAMQKVITVDLISLSSDSPVNKLSSESTDSETTGSDCSKSNASILPNNSPSHLQMGESRDSFSTMPVEEDEVDSLDGSTAPPSPESITISPQLSGLTDKESEFTLAEVDSDKSNIVTVSITDSVSPRTIAVSCTDQASVISATVDTIIEPVRKLERKRKSSRRTPMTDAKRREAADYLVSLGMHYLKLGKYQESVVKFHQSLRLYKTLYGYYHYCVAATWNSIGNAHQLLKRYEEALTSYNEALRILVIVHGEVHSDVALCFHNISELYQRVGFADVAATVRDRCNSIRDELFKISEGRSKSLSLNAESYVESTKSHACSAKSYTASVHNSSKTDLSMPVRAKSSLGIGATPCSYTRSFPYSNSISRRSLPASAGASCSIS